MRRRNNSLSVKVRALESLKKISEGCYDLTSPALTTPAKPLLCQADLFNRTSPFIDESPSVPRSAPIAQTTRTIHGCHNPRPTSAFNIEAAFDDTASFCQKVYTTRLIETQARQNDRQKSLFMRKLAKAVHGSTLNASGYELGPLGAREIADYLQRNTIVQLVLDRNHLKDEGVLELVKVASRLKLRVLSLSSVGMTERSCKPLITQLAGMDSLEELNLSSQQGLNRNRLHRDAFEGIAHLTGSGAGKANIKVLRVGGVGLDDSNFQALCLGLGRGSRLEVLSVEENEITSIGMDHFKEHAVKLHLRFLDISANKIEGGGLVQLGSLIGTDYNLTKISKSLRTLKASKNRIRSGALSNFAKNMANNQTLEELWLDGNPLGEGGKFNLFTSFLARCWSIKRLSLSQSLRSTDEVLMLCDSLQDNRGVQTLFLSRNSLEYCAFKRLLEMLGRNKTLKKLHLQACGVVDSYIVRAQQAIMQLKYLQQLFMDHNFINDNGAQILQRAIFRNKSLVKLQLHNNAIGVKMQKQIDRALAYNLEAKQFNGPDLTYYTYVEELQAQQKNALQATIQELKHKENQLNCRQLLHAIAKRDIQTAHRASQLQKENAELQKIAQISENLKKMEEMKRKVEQARGRQKGDRRVEHANSLQVGDSVISMGDLSSIATSRGVGEQLDEDSEESQDLCNIQQTR